MVRLCVRARSHAGEPPPGGESCVKTMRPRSSSVRSQRLFKASSACSWHASVQGGSWDRRSRVVVSSSCVSPLSCSWIVAGAGRWLFQASESAVLGTALGRKRVEPQAPPASGGQGCPCRSRSRLVRGARPALLSVASAVLSSTVGSPTSPAYAVSLSWRLPPSRGRPWAGCSSRASGRRRAASASSSSRRPARSWPRRGPRPAPCPAAASSSP